MNHKVVIIILSILIIIGTVISLGFMVYNSFNNEMSKVKNPELWVNVKKESHQVIEKEPQKPKVKIIYTDIENLSSGIMNLIYHLESKGVVFKRIEVVRYSKSDANDVDLVMNLYVVHNGIDLVFKVDNSTYTVESFINDVNDVEDKIDLMVGTND